MAMRSEVSSATKARLKDKSIRTYEALEIENVEECTGETTMMQ
jgi:hypothetical protein